MIYENKDDFLAQVSKLKKFKVLGIDFGEKKSGLAIYNSEINLAMPLAIFKEIYKNLDGLFELIQNNVINAIIVGLPLKLDGSATNHTENIVKFTNILELKTKLPIILSDERCTTMLANTLLKEANLKRKMRNQVDDVVVACILLENFFSYANPKSLHLKTREAEINSGGCVKLTN